MFCVFFAAVATANRRCAHQVRRARLRSALCQKRSLESSHIAVPTLDGLTDNWRRDLIRNLDVPDFAVALRGEVGEQLWDDRHIAYLVAAKAEAACDVFKRGPAEHHQAI